MPRKFILVLLVMFDALVVAMTPYLGLLIRFEGNVDSQYYQMLSSYIPVIIIVPLVVFYFFKLYHRLWRYAGISELLAIVGANTVSSVMLFSLIYLSMPGLPRTMYFLSWAFNIFIIGMSRVGVRVLYYWNQNTKRNTDNILIVGAGDAGAMIAREIKHRYYETKKLIGFIDDARYKQNQLLFGAKVLGTCKEIREVVVKYKVNEIIIAMPSAGGSVIREIVHECKKTKCSVKIVPGIFELIDSKVSFQQLRNVDLEDLLRRDPVELDMKQVASYICGKRVLVTGAGGSIGSELCRQIAKMSPKTLILLGKGENSIFEIHQELRIKHPDLPIEPIIADVRDRERIDAIFSELKPRVVFHSAAHKHVPLMEKQPAEAVRNNIFGTKNVAEAADRAGSEAFVMISTDKAVNPTSVMGATKRVAELIVQNMSTKSATKFVAVRFGNVLGSRGSVIPLFKKQIAMGGPITVTHPDMQRYFMTIPEAAQLVLQAGALAKGGEVFVLDMGKPVKIVDMARDLIELSGLNPDKDIKIKFTGLRPGEKLFEELLTAEEGTTSTKHEKIYIANLKSVNKENLLKAMNKLDSATLEPEEVVRLLQGLVLTYKPNLLTNKMLEQKFGPKEHNNQNYQSDALLSSLNL
ncbi:UDP-N-acetyl-alpha-D-glucosamine C6 dehydratase [Sporomusa rhizae]|uniref:polysaccharide biosynthesis protein n=1 Tax=Sporomusa rhizae TaxID=357999 RepID=UPI00352B9214